jgi:hypothetical protein
MPVDADSAGGYNRVRWRFRNPGENMVRRALVMLVVVLYALQARGGAPTDYAKKIKHAPWLWDNRDANLLMSALQTLQGFDVQVNKPANTDGLGLEFSVRVLRDGKEVLAFPAHAQTVLARRGNVLYRADYYQCATGCSVVALDLHTGKKLWKCALVGIGPTAHSDYGNEVCMVVEDGLIVIYGRESNGRYIEYVDAKSGKSLANKTLPPEK